VIHALDIFLGKTEFPQNVRNSLHEKEVGSPSPGRLHGRSTIIFQRGTPGWSVFANRLCAAHEGFSKILIVGSDGVDGGYLAGFEAYAPHVRAAVDAAFSF
jgi:hypothetical protein